MNKVWLAGVLSLLLAAAPGHAQGPQPPAGKARGPQRGGPIVLNPDDVPAFPDPPAGFDAVRPDAPHGKLEMVSYESKSVGTTRTMQVYTQPLVRVVRSARYRWLLGELPGYDTTPASEVQTVR
jgi:hypothetical protein